MAHLPPSTAIFSPSVARIAASTAKDWNYVDSWLSTKFHGRTPPPFERNPDTLKALLALAALNETADEERELLARVEATALHECTAKPAAAADGALDPATARAALVAAIESALPREGRQALDALAASAAALGIAHPSPEAVGRAAVELSARAGELEQAAARVDVLTRHVAAETARARAMLGEVGGEAYRPPAHLAKQNLEMQRRLKAGAAALPDARDRAADAAWKPEIMIEEVHEREKEYLALLSRKKDLEAQVNAFQGLPPDRELARQELEALRAELRGITRRRDAVFEGLVERETPRKGI